MSGDGSSVTLIFYRIGSAWWKEPALNLLAAAAQMSSYCHVEIGIGVCVCVCFCVDAKCPPFLLRYKYLAGEAPGSGGQIANVARIFNDAIGVVNV
jgi:hypothetical protein